ncbi:MAG: alpha/beta fold hydrolase [Ilumatobacteraceae bacterium]|jgi:pimeloyl-ACP methyl ester carboxylesterase
MGRIAYDEFSMFGENIAEYSLTASAHPVVSRVTTELADGRQVSALKWGSESPRLVLVHGTAQNAHTWDTVALALGMPLLAIDLPGHGHSDWRQDASYTPQTLANDLAPVVAQHAPDAVAIVGMSLGGLTCLALAHGNPSLVRHLVMVDITPGVTSKKAKAVLDFINGPQSFASFDELLARTKEHNPTRSESSLRRGILHNARQLDDESWEWRYDRRGRSNNENAPREGEGESAAPRPDSLVLWEAISSLHCELLLVRGGISPVVDDEDVAELKRRKPNAVVEVVDGAGHSVQGDRPVELAKILARFG